MKYNLFENIQSMLKSSYMKQKPLAVIPGVQCLRTNSVLGFEHGLDVWKQIVFYIFTFYTFMLKRILCNKPDFGICELYYPVYDYDCCIYIYLFIYHSMTSCTLLLSVKQKSP
jgi:hypothetical protein